MSLTAEQVREIEEKARQIRQTILQMLVAAGSGHTAGPLGMADIFAAFYFHILRHDPKNPNWEERDRLVLSNGHICPVLYAAMAHAGYLPIEECLTLRKFGSRLQGHPERLRLEGLETTSGPLGEGLSQAAGMAYSFKNLKSQAPNPKPRIYCLMSDGEQQEGSTWEAVMFAGKYQLSNLIAIMDRNNIQIDGKTEDVMPLEPLADKYRAFNWHVIETDGNDIPAFITAVEEALNAPATSAAGQMEKGMGLWKEAGKALATSAAGRPTLIIAHTISGKGVPEIEGDYRWHGRVPTREEGERFLKYLNI